MTSTLPAVAIAVAQVRHEVAIELDRDDALRARRQQVGQRAAPRSDLDDDVVRRRRQRVRDALERGTIDEKVLAESLARVRQELARSSPCVRAPRDRARMMKRESDPRLQLRTMTSARSSGRGDSPTCALQRVEHALENRRGRLVPVLRDDVEHGLLTEADAGVVARVGHAVREQQQQIRPAPPRARRAVRPPGRHA